MEELEKLLLDENIKLKIKEWLNQNIEPQDKEEIIKLIKEKNEKELTDRFFKDLEFGTGGLRGIIGIGSNRMNKYNVWKATQGLCNYLKKQFNDDIKIVIAYDSRHFSDIFALETALVAAGNDIKVFLFESLRPTPMLSFAVRHLNANAGVVITASHNPPEYNGYKVYWQDGGQIVPPHDKNIISNVNEITSLTQIKHISKEEAINNKLLEYIGDNVDSAYYDKVASLCINPEIIKEISDKIKIVYTPIHGSGNIPVRHMLKRLGFKNVFVVKEQEKPDGNFPTVKTPNPEESEALKLGLELCKEVDADILIGTDPDSDRLGAAVKDKTGEYILLNGNQIASLLAYYIFSQLKEKNKLPENALLVNTIVTTDLLLKIAHSFNVSTFSTLTGFKYIGEQIKINEELKKQGKEYKQYIFGGEESYGMLAGDFVRDKDAVISASLFCEMAAFLKYHNKIVPEYLDEIYKKYGYFKEALHSITLKGKEGMEKIKKIMESFRDAPPKEIIGLKLLKIGDLLKGTIVDINTNKIEYNYPLPKSNVLVLFFEKNVKITMRPSGTEPKIKFYFACNNQNAKNLDETKKEVSERLNKVIENFLNLVNNIK